ncbi:MAG TPA: hypothetical protein VHS59_14790 [Bacillota bacterium]|nr:hypothetical protein [Bacillota bacterium]
MRFFQPLQEELIIRHITKLTPVERDSLEIVHFGTLSSRIVAQAKKRLWKTVAFAEFFMALESKNGPLSIGLYRVFGPNAGQLRELKTGDKVYVRAIPINDPEEKWYYVLEVEPANKLGNLPLKYKDLLSGENVNKIK